LNNDTLVLPEAFDRMLTFLRQHPEAGAVGSRLLNEDGTTQWSVKTLPDLGSAVFGGRALLSRWFPNNRFTRKRFLHFDRELTEPFVAGYLSGASKMMPRAVVDQVGYLDDSMFYHVDADYCKRIADAGYKCYYLPTAEVVHLNHKGGTTSTARARLRSMLSFHRDCYAYYCKHIQQSRWSPLRPVIVVGLVLHFVALLVAQMARELASLARSLARRNDPAF